MQAWNAATNNRQTTVKEYNYKQLEYFEFCEALYSDTTFVYAVSATKLFQFLFYQAFRENRTKKHPNLLTVQKVESGSSAVMRT
jgi:hypothetical protein